MNEERLRENLRNMEANTLVTHLLLVDLLSTLPQAEEVLQRFQRTVERMTQAAPDGTDPEFLVEFRARAQQTVAQTRLASRDAKPFQSDLG